MDLTFTQYVNNKIHAQFSSYDHSVIFGQNIVSGSRISGLGAGLDQIKNCRALNTTNSENSLMGLGFGLALSSTPSLFLMKQHDFALLGLDQLTNTYNVLRNDRFLAPFIVLMVVVDSGFEGPQASLNNLDDFASLTRAPVYFLSSKENIDKAFKDSTSPGLYFMALSQKNMKQICAASEKQITEFDEAISYNYITSQEILNIAVVFYGVEISIAEDIARILNEHNIAVKLFTITKLGKMEMHAKSFNEITSYKKIIILDTGKSEIHYSTDLAFKLKNYEKDVDLYQRTSSKNWSEVNNDAVEFSNLDIVKQILKGV